ncbi:hypothetical protein [Thermus thermamylovorans]|uniref:Uncharacterized protein n=1 Tax=Thermus thermamylovorans TaxID=2509362 RepID=A0A4Q9B4Z3_9DEIN|nr:hypothetical protein [Thermus thermamylovorans]TBH20657.1 hypothetical protein ETP66_06210 [Thermus thermamylovorans]
MGRLFPLPSPSLGPASAQSTTSLPFGYGEGLGLSFGAGVENRLRQNLSGRLTAELAPGMERLWDPCTGLFAGGAHVYGLADFPKAGRFAWGANFR